MEIERKFLVDLGKIDFNLEAMEGTKIHQPYIAINPELRLRKMNNTHYFTYKGSGDLSRREIEFEIPEEEYINLVNREISHISKTRYAIHEVGNKIELDIYQGELTGLVVAEVEFDSEESAFNYDPPSWFGKEVTYDDRYKNKNLAMSQCIPK
jgi:CYTH domain-containing protein